MMPYRLIRKRFVIKPFPLDDGEMAKPSPRLRELLGLVVCQAMHDGMLEVHIGIDPATGDSFMKYFGPFDWEPEKRIWWDMVAPPARFYARMLQICISLVSRVRDQLPIKGLIPAVKNRRRLTVYLTVEEINSFRISWDRDHAAGHPRARDRNANTSPAKVAQTDGVPRHDKMG